MSSDLNREELNQLAAEKGIENPESYGTKAELQEAIDALETPNEEVPEEQTSLVDDAPEEEAEAESSSELEDHTTEETLEDAVDTAEENHEADVATPPAEPGSEADGTAELETPQNAFDSRNEAVELGKETARENIEKERAENQVDGE